MKTSMARHMSFNPLTIKLTRSPLVISRHCPQVHFPLKPHGPTMTFSSRGLVPMKFIRKNGRAPMATTSRMDPPAPVAAASYGRGTQGEQWLSILPTNMPGVPGNLKAAASSPGPTTSEPGNSLPTFLFKASMALKSMALSILWWRWTKSACIKAFSMSFMSGPPGRLDSFADCAASMLPHPDGGCKSGCPGFIMPPSKQPGTPPQKTFSPGGDGASCAEALKPRRMSGSFHADLTLRFRPLTGGAGGRYIRFMNDRAPLLSRAVRGKKRLPDGRLCPGPRGRGGRAGRRPASGHPGPSRGESRLLQRLRPVGGGPAGPKPWPSSSLPWKSRPSMPANTGEPG